MNMFLDRHTFVSEAADAVQQVPQAVNPAYFPQNNAEL